MKTTLTVEQSAKLIELGVSFERASGRTFDLKDVNNLSKPIERCELLPVFKLADLIDILPKFIPDAGGDLSYALKIQPCNLPGWQVCYYAYSLDKGKGYKSSPELIDALYSLLVWCLEKGYVKLD